MQPARYSRVAMILHWLIAGLILTNLIIGFEFPHPAPGQMAPKPLLPLHMSIGLTVLLLSLMRLGWRLLRPPPAHRAGMPRWEIRAANITHAAFYALMIGIPLSGWLIMSARKVYGAKLMFWGLIAWPRFSVLQSLGVETLDGLHHVFVTAHQIAAQQIFLALLALHLGAVAKHHLIDRDPILWRILGEPRRRRSETPRASGDL